jgi:sortase A
MSPEIQTGDAAAAKTRSRAGTLGVIGEIFITAGVLVLLYLVWQLWFNDLVVGNQQQGSAQDLSQNWGKGDSPQPAPSNRADPGDPIVTATPAKTATFANIIVPRFGETYTRPVGEGISTSNVLRVGVGHYPGTQMPGAIGNVGLAGHRTTWGAPFSNIADLRVGDSVYLETADGWYRYVFRSLEYVKPSGIGVLDPVPQARGVAATDRLLTMTSCNPKFSAAERIVAYSVYDTWYPRADGPPAEIAQTIHAVEGN